VSPPPDRVHHQHRLVAWLRTSGGLIALHALLISLAVVNLYPFVWMAGTGVKEQLESVSKARTALPLLKYGLSDSEDAALLAPFSPDGQLIEMADITATEAAKQQAESVIAARQAAEAIDPTINDTQRRILKTLRESTIIRRCIYRTYIPYRIDIETAAADYGYTRPDPDDPTGKRRLPDINRARADLDALAARGLLAPVRFQFENYVVVWRDMQFWLYTATSFLTTSAVVMIVVLMSSMLGFALARLKFPGKMLVLMLLLFSSVAPSEAVIIPIFRFFMATGLMDNLWAMTLWMAGVSIGNAFLMAGFFLSLPKEVEEAARVDGAGPFRTFFMVALPMARPIVMTVGLLAFLGAWNNFLVPLLTSQSRPEFQPLALAIFMFKSGYEGFWHWVNAAATIMVVPVALLFLLLQRYIVNAIAVGAVKG
jgi:ABC-type glycerol-3-phosphate transport system permease component